MRRDKTTEKDEWQLRCITIIERKQRNGGSTWDTWQGGYLAAGELVMPWNSYIVSRGCKASEFFRDDL
jgi:hypothetical protein